MSAFAAEFVRQKTTAPLRFQFLLQAIASLFPASTMHMADIASAFTFDAPVASQLLATSAAIRTAYDGCLAFFTAFAIHELLLSVY